MREDIKELIGGIAFMVMLLGLAIFWFGILPKII